MIGVLVFATICFSLATGVNIGRAIERGQWNKLIEEGKLPKPKITTTKHIFYNPEDI